MRSVALYGSDAVISAVQHGPAIVEFVRFVRERHQVVYHRDVTQKHASTTYHVQTQFIQDLFCGAIVLLLLIESLPHVS